MTTAESSFNGLSRSPLSGADIPAAAGPAVRQRFTQFGSIYRWLLLGVMLCGSLATLLAATTINVALPAIIGAFGLGQDQAQWMSTAFLASATIAMLANAWTMASFGARLTYLAGMTLFVTGSLLGFVSTSLELLIVARVLQGVAAGLLQPMSMYLIFQAFPDNRRGTAMGIFSIGVVLAPAFGPALGGFAVDMASWRLVFLATVPLALIAFPLAAMLMPDRDSGRDVKRPPLDWIGLLLMIVTVVGLLSTISGGARLGWDSDITLIKLFVALLAGITFVWWEGRHPFPALDPAIFRHRQFATAAVVIFSTGTAIYGSTYLIPQLVQVVQGYSPSAAGIMMIPAGMAMLLGFPIAGRLTDQVDTRWLIAFGIVSFAVSAWLLSNVWLTTPYWVLVGWVVLSRVGISFCMAPSNTTAVRGVPPQLLASATGAVSFLAQVGGAFGVSLLAILLQRRTIYHGQHFSEGMTEANSEMLYTHAMTMRDMTTNGVPVEQAFSDAFRPMATLVTEQATVYAYRDCFLVVAVFFAVVFLSVLVMPKPRLALPESSSA